MNTFFKLMTIAVSYLILAIPASSATTVHIIFQGFPEIPVEIPELVNGMGQGEIVVFQENPPFGSYMVSLSLSNATDQQLQTLYVFACKDLTPSACVSTVSPSSYAFVNSELDVVLPWTDLRDTNQGFPQMGNILLVVKTSNAYGGGWIGTWHTLIRNDNAFTPPYHFTSELGDVDATVPTIEDRATVKDFIEEYALLPMSNIDTITFTGATSLTHLSSNAPPSFTPSDIAGNTMDTISALYDLVVPLGVATYNPITVTDNPENFLCGGDFDNDGDHCDAGETSTNCCYDCGCPGGQYCDNERGCQSLSAVNLQVIPPTNTQVSNCNEENTVTVTVRMNNPPTDVAITGQSYVLNATQNFPLGCTADGNVHTCPIVVPADPDCDEGSFNHTDNYVYFDITYSDGPDHVSDQLSVLFPDIIVSSWVCGDLICDTLLGEDPTNCCYDCTCSTGQYCDVGGSAEPNTGMCASLLTNASLSITNVTPESFPIYSGSGNDVTFDYFIVPPPESLELGTEACSTTCNSEGNACTAPCTVACAHGNDEASCSLSFTIVGYDNLKGYVVTPSVQVPVTYNDGAVQIMETLTGTLPAYAFGPHFCGDLVCNPPDETSENCCFDCGCQPGSFCNTITTSMPSDGDNCRETNLALMIDPIENTTFVDQTLTHEVNFTGTIAPQFFGFEIVDQECSLGGGELPCTMLCSIVGDNVEQYDFQCSLTIPAIDYQESPFFNDDTKKLHLLPNFFNLSVGYNNGSVVAVQHLAEALPEFVVTPIAHCGIDACEVILGESSATCCIDCACAGGDICIPGGDNPMSLCIAEDDIQAVITEVDPQPLICDIQPPHVGGDCVFLEGIDVIINITNAPGDLYVVDVVQEIDGQEQESVGSFCYQLTHDSVRCSLFFENIEGESSFGGGDLVPGTFTRDLRLTLATTFSNGGFVLSKEFVAGTELSFELQKSDALLTCEEQHDDLSGELEDLEGTRDLVLGILIALWGITIGFCAATFFGCGICEAICEWGIILSSCASAALLPWLGQLEGKIGEISIQRDLICAAEDTGQLRSSILNSNTLWSNLGGVGAGLVCVAGLGAAFNAESLASPLGWFGGGTSTGAAIPYSVGGPSASAPGSPAGFAIV